MGKYLKQTKLFFTSKNTLISGALLIPIVLFYLPILLTGHHVYLGDFDMQTQMTEAARKTIVEYGQFPLWNPWVSGGVPLFADPQFGLISPQTLLAFFVGSVLAWKVTMVLYMMVGFTSMRSLLNRVTKSTAITNIILAYIWVFSSMFVLRMTGHFTFILFALLPLGLLLALNLARGTKKDTILFGIFLTFCLYQALHYSVIMMIVIIFAFLALQAISILLRHQKKNILKISFLLSYKPLLLAGLALIAALTIAAPRIYMSFEYMHDNLPDRNLVHEKFIGIDNGLRAIFCPYQLQTCIEANNYASQTTWGMFEASTYIGMSTFVAIIFSIVILYRRKLLTTLKDYPVFLPIFIIFGVSFVLGLGGFFYTNLSELPVFSSMRVSTRWFFISATAIVILLAILSARILQSKSIPRTIKTLQKSLLGLALVEVAVFNILLGIDLWKPSFLILDLPPVSHNESSVISQELNWNQWSKRGANYYAVTEATYHNVGQIRADTALLETSRIGTDRCDKDSAGCNFVMTNNATVTAWTPNKIVLLRTGPGPITLNTNPGTHWRINGRYPFLGIRTTDSHANFTINDSSDTLTIEYVPLPTVVIKRLEKSS